MTALGVLSEGPAEAPAEASAEGMAQACAACAARPLALCGVLSGAAQWHMLDAVRQDHEVAAGGQVFAEGAPAKDLFTIAQGMAKLYKLLPDGRRQVIGFLGPGDLLGLSAGTGYPYSAEAVTALSLCRFARRRLEPLLARLPQVQRRLFAQATEELALARDQMLLLGRKTARERISSFLLLLSRRAARRGEGASPVFAPMSRTDIADHLGLTTETVSRQLTLLKTMGVISLLSGHKIALNDLSALRALAGD